MISTLIQWIRKIKKRQGLDGRYIDKYPPGHFYSPIPSWPPLKKDEVTVSVYPKGIDLQVNEQLNLLNKFSEYYSSIPSEWITPVGGNLRYRFQNPFFTYGDAIVYYSFLRHFKPKKVIEIGSGWSSALFLDVNELFFNFEVESFFIDPDTTRISELLTTNDRVTILGKPIQEVDTEVVQSLQAGDFLIIDSSHVGKYKSDLLYIIFELLPILDKGVIVHFHDIFWPFEYPESWLENGRAWNEAYFVRALLQNNTTWKIKLFNSYLELHHLEEYKKVLPMALTKPLNKMTKGNSSLWLEKNT